MLREPTTLKTAAGMKNRQDSGVVPAMVNVRQLPYVIPHSMPPTGEESDEQTRAYRKEEMNAEEADPARGAAGRPRQDGGASPDFLVRVGGNFCFESGGYYYRGGCDGGSYGSGRREHGVK
jgi:hypothetical protein